MNNSLNPANARATYLPPESEALLLSVEQALLDNSRERIETLIEVTGWDAED